MQSFGSVAFSQAGAARQPSPSIWKDCPQEQLNSAGLGWYRHVEFLGTPLVNTTITAALLSRLTVDGMAIDGDDDTVLTQTATRQGGFIDLETDGDDNDAVALFMEPTCEIVLNSGNKVWFEARFEPGALADQGLFFGIAEKAALSRDVVADNTITLIGESLIGFQMLSDDTDGVDAVFKLDGGTVVEMASDIGFTSTALGSSVFHLVADTDHKFGFMFDGKDQIQLFVDGVKVSSYTIVAATFPDNVKMGPIIGYKTGAGAAVSVAFDWIRVGYQQTR